MPDSQTYVVIARTAGSAMSVGTQDPANALKRAPEMQSNGSTVTIVDRDGNLHTVAELEASVLSGKYARPASAGAQDRA